MPCLNHPSHSSLSSTTADHTRAIDFQLQFIILSHAFNLPRVPFVSLRHYRYYFTSAHTWGRIKSACFVPHKHDTQTHANMNQEIINKGRQGWKGNNIPLLPQIEHFSLLKDVFTCTNRELSTNKPNLNTLGDYFLHHRPRLGGNHSMWTQSQIRKDLGWEFNLGCNCCERTVPAAESQYDSQMSRYCNPI